MFNFVVVRGEHHAGARADRADAADYVHVDEFAHDELLGERRRGPAPLQPVDVNLDPDPADRISTSGCEDADFAGFAAGDVALVQRGTCTFAEKAVNAQEAGASGVVVFNQGNDPGRVGVVAGTLGETAQDGEPDPPDVTVPVMGISFADRRGAGQRRRARGCTWSSTRPATSACRRT